MTDPARFCENCGAPLTENANFCEACGHKVTHVEPSLTGAAAVPSQSTRPEARVAPVEPPAPVFPAAAGVEPGFAPPAKPPTRSRLPFILGGVGCLVVLCIGVVVAAVLLLKPDEPSITQSPTAVSRVVISTSTVEGVPTVIPLAPAQTGEAPAVPTAPASAAIPALPTLPASGDLGAWSQDSGQLSTEEQLRDNFDSLTYDWGIAGETDYTWSVENGVYNAHVKTADYYTWTYVPSQFDPTGIFFDAQVQPGYTEGAYGALCHIQDEDNFYYAVVDPQNQEYFLGFMKDGDDNMLLEDWWLPAQYLRGPVEAINQVAVECTAERITLYLNGQVEASAKIDPPAETGPMALYAETWEEMPPGGYQVVFDNVIAYK